MVDTSLVSEWLSKADEDLEFGRVNLEEKKNFFRIQKAIREKLNPSPQGSK